MAEYDKFVGFQIKRMQEYINRTYVTNRHGGAMPKFDGAYGRRNTTPRVAGQYRQGDILLKPVSAARAAAGREVVGANDERKVLAYGEESGHAHAVLDDSAKLVEVNGTLYLVVDTPGATITHEEHPPVKVPAGNYEITRQRQYVPDAPDEWVYD